MIPKAALFVIFLLPIWFVISASSMSSALGQIGCGSGTKLNPSTNECVPAVKCGAGTVLSSATNQCELATTSQTTQPNATNATTSQTTQPNATNATTSQTTQPNATNATTSQTTQPNATEAGEVGSATAGTTVVTGGASNQCTNDEVSLGNLCVPRSCTELLNSFAMNLRGLTQEQLYKQCADAGLLSK